MFQIVFNEISAAELSKLGTLEQLELLEEFKVGKEDLENLNGDRFGKIDRDGRVRYLHRGYREGMEEAYERQIRELVKE